MSGVVYSPGYEPEKRQPSTAEEARALALKNMRDAEERLQAERIREATPFNADEVRILDLEAKLSAKEDERRRSYDLGWNAGMNFAQGQASSLLSAKSAELEEAQKETDAFNRGCALAVAGKPRPDDEFEEIGWVWSMDAATPIDRLRTVIERAREWAEEGHAHPSRTDDIGQEIEGPCPGVGECLYAALLAILEEAHA
jgi:hypothetical protein